MELELVQILEMLSLIWLKQHYSLEEEQRIPNLIK